MVLPIELDVADDELDAPDVVVELEVLAELDPHAAAASASAEKARNAFA